MRHKNAKIKIFDFPLGMEYPIICAEKDCKEEITRAVQLRNNLHKNITQDPMYNFFCCRKCKEKWIYFKSKQKRK